MLSFENSQGLELTLDAMRSIGGQKDYLQQVLFPALLRGNWEELDKMVVYQDERKTILFGEDAWMLAQSAYKGKNKPNIYFNIKLEQDNNVIVLRQNERHLVNQVKCVAVADMWFSGQHIELSSLKSKIDRLRNCIVKLFNRGITSFEELNQKHLEILVEDGLFDMSNPQVF
ncbi:TPA: integrase, partial [Vibrio vulnificus]|nr:integrase [Vibrio vulnificus]HAS6295457.1 integrase [Vibrio vulnificus]HAS6318557.1 integrase [Vibrio vulnificus]HDY7558543.1 integrase [Vibrio vulnificus]HDY7576686.1 integrase [Vibrio vulnificus]